MIEILFGDSEAGSMKVAKSSNTTIIGGMNGKKIEWITGNSDEVICLAFMLDIGDNLLQSFWRRNYI